METGLWKVEFTYAFCAYGSTNKGTFYVGANDVGTASNLAVEFLNKMSRFDKRIVSITDTGSTLFSN